MRMPIKKLRRIVREELAHVPVAPQVTVDMLSSFQSSLDDKLTNGELTLSEYEREWIDTLKSVGWTEDMYEREVDRRWDYVDSTRDVPVHSGKQTIN